MSQRVKANAITLVALLAVTVPVGLGVGSASGRAVDLKTTTIAITDAKGDGGLPEWDILSGEVVQDRAASTVQATITLAGPTGASSSPARLRVALGYSKATGRCTVKDPNSGDEDTGGHVPPGTDPVYILEGSLHLITTLDDSMTSQGNPAYFIIGAFTPPKGDVAKTRADSTITLTTSVSAYFAQTGWNCALVTTETVNSFGTTITHDTAEAFAPDEVTPTRAAVPPPIGSSPTMVLDADKDGVPDTSDVCPQLAGAGLNGCETTPVGKAVKLGTKRVVIDKLVSATGSKCPPAVKVTAVLKGKTLGKKLIGTLQHGSFCQVKGVLALTKKVSKTRVTIAASGVTSFAVTVAR